MRLFDDFTPREVWLEYTSRKQAIAASALCGADYERALEDLATMLGCGLPHAELTVPQQHAQRAAIDKWRGEL
jgi:hypothetical protein